MPKFLSLSGSAQPKYPTMSSVELVEIINSLRVEDAPELRHDNFMVKIERHPGIQSPKFLGDYKDARGRVQKCYHLPRRECELMVMSESLEVQTRVYDRMVALEQGTAPALKDPRVEALGLIPNAVRAARAFGFDKNVAAISANQAVFKITGANVLQLMGQTHLEAERQDTQWFTPTELGERIKVSARAFNAQLALAGLQVKASAGWEVTEAGKPFSRLFDTGKSRSSGVPVAQIKWSPKVLAVLELAA